MRLAALVLGVIFTLFGTILLADELSGDQVSKGGVETAGVMICLVGVGLVALVVRKS